MTTIAIKAVYANLLQHFESNEQTRYYLNGFNVKPQANGGAVLAATDGHICGIFHDVDAIVEGDTIWRLSKAGYKACAKPKRRENMDDPLWLTIQPINNSWHEAVVVYADTAQNALTIARDKSLPENIVHSEMLNPVDGTFPDYLRIVPDVENFNEAEVVVPSFNYNLMQPFMEVARVDMFENVAQPKSTCAQMTVWSFGGKSASVVLTRRTDFFGVLMPMRSGCIDEIPKWFNEQHQNKLESVA
jgi:hypothetical protein